MNDSTDEQTMDKMVSNIVFTKNRPLQLHAYLESLYKYFPSELIQTYIIYKVEFFAAEYELLFRKFPGLIVIKEKDFHSDFLKVLNQINTKYILFGIDDVVFFDSVDFDVIDKTFYEHNEDIFGFALRFSPEFLKDGDDIIVNIDVAGQEVHRLNWKNSQTAHTRYPFELCCTFYRTSLLWQILDGLLSTNVIAKKFFKPDSGFIRALSMIGSARSVLKRLAYFYCPMFLANFNH